MPSWHFSLTVFFCVESSKSSLPKGGSRREDAISPGRSTKFGEISGQGSSKIAVPTRYNGASASPDKDKGKQPRHENKVSVENDEENDQNTEEFKVVKGLSGNKDEKWCSVKMYCNYIIDKYTVFPRIRDFKQRLRKVPVRWREVVFFVTHQGLKSESLRYHEGYSGENVA